MAMTADDTLAVFDQTAQRLIGRLPDRNTIMALAGLATVYAQSARRQAGSAFGIRHRHGAYRRACQRHIAVARGYEQRASEYEELVSEFPNAVPATAQSLEAAYDKGAGDFFNHRGCNTLHSTDPVIQAEYARGYEEEVDQKEYRG